MSKTKCPRCSKYFDDNFKRYVIGSTTNTIKFTTHFALRACGSIVGGVIGFGNDMVARGCGRLGGKIADAIGCGEKDLTGWQHKCPYCGHRWD